MSSNTPDSITIIYKSHEVEIPFASSIDAVRNLAQRAHDTLIAVRALNRRPGAEIGIALLWYIPPEEPSVVGSALNEVLPRIFDELGIDVPRRLEPVGLMPCRADLIRVMEENPQGTLGDIRNKTLILGPLNTTTYNGYNYKDSTRTRLVTPGAFAVLGKTLLGPEEKPDFRKIVGRMREIFPQGF